MKDKLPKLLIGLLIVGAVSWFVYILQHVNLLVLFPDGLIAMKERNLIFIAMGSMLSLAIPVVLVTFFITWKYRAGNKKAKYTPNWTGNIYLKALWWAILCAFVAFFFVIVWNSAHQLDPYKPLDSQVKPLTIEVVALQWKWLFIYPDQHIATVNFLEVPAHTPLNFKLTADAPMTSFWIPALGGQIYAMSSMETKLHLMANKEGDYQGKTTEINGDGYAGMEFTTRVSSKGGFDKWVSQVEQSGKVLDLTTYDELAKPSENTPIIYYSTVEDTLYNTIIMKYMKPTPVPGHYSVQE